MMASFTASNAAYAAPKKVSGCPLTKVTHLDCSTQSWHPVAYRTEPALSIALALIRALNEIYCSYVRSQKEGTSMSTLQLAVHSILGSCVG